MISSHVIQVQPPTVWPVTLADMKRQLVIEDSYTPDDQYIQFLITVYTRDVEAYLMQYLSQQQVSIRVPGDQYEGTPSQRAVECAAIRIPTPASSIVSIVRTHGGIDTAIDTAQYRIDQYDTPNHLVPIYGYRWPSAEYYTITLAVGKPPAEVNAVFKDAIMILVADAYENRIEVVRDRKSNVYRLLDKWRVSYFVDWISDMYDDRLTVQYAGSTLLSAHNPQTYDSLADAIAAGLGVGDTFIYSAANIDGYAAGTRVTIVQDMI